MARVLSIHLIDLRPGVTEAELEKAMEQATYSVPGQTVYLLKGNRGARTGRYAIMAEFESMELRDRYFPASGEPSEEWQRLAAPFAAELERVGTLTTWPDPEFTDYTVVSQTK
jgi:hypothetical protein